LKKVKLKSFLLISLLFASLGINLTAATPQEDFTQNNSIKVTESYVTSPLNISVINNFALSWKCTTDITGCIKDSLSGACGIPLIGILACPLVIGVNGILDIVRCHR